VVAGIDDLAIGGSKGGCVDRMRIIDIFSWSAEALEFVASRQVPPAQGAFPAYRGAWRALPSFIRQVARSGPWAKRGRPWP
jgi:hypothetical protein